MKSWKAGPILRRTQKNLIIPDEIKNANLFRPFSTLKNGRNFRKPILFGYSLLGSSVRNELGEAKYRRR